MATVGVLTKIFGLAAGTQGFVILSFRFHVTLGWKDGRGTWDPICLSEYAVQRNKEEKNITDGATNKQKSRD